MDIAGIRKALGYNQAKFGRALGVCEQVVIQLEHYTIVPSLAMKEQIKDLCDRNNIDWSKYELREAVRYLMITRNNKKKGAID